MSGQTRILLEAPRSLLQLRGSQALMECPVMTRAVGRTATDSGSFWFTTWDWDTQAIWTTVRGFFDAYNSGRYDQCLDYMSENMVGKGTSQIIDLLRLAKAHRGHISVEAITDLTIAGSRASGTIDLIIGSSVTRQNVSFVKETGSWRISGSVLSNDDGSVVRDWLGRRGEGLSPWA